MPRVPTVDNFSVAPSDMPQPRFNATLTPEVASAQGREMVNTGRAAQQVANAYNSVVLRELEEANKLRVQDAINQRNRLRTELLYASQGGMLSQMGINALERPDNKPLADEYAEKYQKAIDDIEATLGNDAQRQLFRIDSEQDIARVYDMGVRHSADQFKAYSTDVRKSTVDSRLSQMPLLFNNPQEVDLAINDIKNAIREQGRVNGEPTEMIEQKARVASSKAHLSALQTALDKNEVVYANDYLKRYAKDMEADDILKVDKLLGQRFDERVAIQTVDGVMREMRSRLQPNDDDRLATLAGPIDFARLDAAKVQVESSGRRFDKEGKLLEGPMTRHGTAKGEHQVLDSTNADPGFGVQPARDNSPEERARVGRDYLAAMLRRYGDPAKALAAYNAGPGRVDADIKKAEKENGFWLDYAPKETQDYVSKVLKRYTAGEGKTAPPTTAEIYDVIRERVGTDNPERLRMAINEYDRRASVLARSEKEQADQAVAEAYQALLQNGGKFDALPVTLTGRVPMADMPKVMDFAARVAKGDDVTDLSVYNKLASNPDYLASLSDAQFMRFRNGLSENDFKYFAKDRARLREKRQGIEKSNDLGEINNASIKATLDDRLRMMGVDPSPKDGTADAMRVGAIRRYVNESLMAAQASNGKKLSDVDIAKAIDSMLAKTTTYSGLFSDSKGPMLGMRISDVPNDAKRKIKEAFKNRGNDNPSDGEILNAYWRHLTRGAKQ